MTYTDLFTRLAGTVGTPAGAAAVPQDLDPATAAAGLLSESWYDLGAGPNAVGEGDKRMALVTIAEEDVDASTTENATVEFRLISSPRTTLAGLTFTGTAASDIVTAAGHGYPAGTAVLLTTSAADLPAPLAVSTHYYVINPTTDTFQLALTPGGAAIDITDAGTGTHTVTHVPTILGSSGPVPQMRLKIGDGVIVRMNPLLRSPVSPRHRYLFMQFLPSADLTAGKCFVDLVLDAKGAEINYPIGMTVL